MIRKAQDGNESLLEEGWVVRSSKGEYAKIKTWQYKAISMLRRYGLTKKQITRTYFILEKNKWLLFLNSLPECLQDPINEYAKELQDKIDAFSLSIRELYDKYGGLQSQAQFALEIQNQVSPDFRSLLFALRRGELVSIEKAIRKKFLEQFDQTQVDGEIVPLSLIKAWALQAGD